MHKIALIGSPNVGKSTLFNRLTGTQNAIVNYIPGITIDRQYGIANFNNHKFIIIDTGGINIFNKNLLQKKIHDQALIAIEEAEIILFILDGRNGILNNDLIIAQYLRKINKKNTLIIANKIDEINIKNTISEFYSIGIKNIIPISASHGKGINLIIEKIISIINNKNNNPFTYNKKVNIKVAIVGRQNVGKSTLINCLLGEERLIVYNIPGTTRDSIPIHYNNNIIFIDTAGIHKNTLFLEKITLIKTFKTIKTANIIIMVIDAISGIYKLDLYIINYIINKGKSIIITINKWDTQASEQRKAWKKIISYKLNFIYKAPIHFISALHRYGTYKILKSIKETYKYANTHINTAKLTKIMHIAIKKNPPQLIHGRKIKLKYAHWAGYNPIKIIIHGNKVNYIKHTYKKFLINFFTKFLKLKGTPIKIYFKNNINPFN